MSTEETEPIVTLMQDQPEIPGERGNRKQPLLTLMYGDQHPYTINVNPTSSIRFVKHSAVRLFTLLFHLTEPVRVKKAFAPLQSSNLR